MFTLCVLPTLNWYLQGIRWIPLGEGFMLMHLVYYVFPCVQEREDWDSISDRVQLLTMLAVFLFLVAFLVVYQFLLKIEWGFLNHAKLLRREMRTEAMWTLFALWVISSVAMQSHLIPDLASYTNVYNSAIVALGSLGIAYLFFRMGQGKMPLGQWGWSIGGLGLGLAANFANGFLQGNAQTMGAAVLTYTLGRKRVPFTGIAIGLVILTVLQLGKHEFRDIYWGDEAKRNKDNLVEQYEVWLGAGLGHLMSSEDSSSEDTQSVFARSSLIQVLALAIASTNDDHPYLYGKTYAMLPEMLIPRFLWPDKPRGTHATETVGIYYGIQTERGAESTGISVGPLTEGWANGGWVGMIFAGAVLAVLFGIPARISSQLNPSQVGWLLCAVVLTYSIKMELCIPEILSSLIQAMVVAFVMLYLFSRPPEREHPVVQSPAAARAMSARR